MRNSLIWGCLLACFCTAASAQDLSTPKAPKKANVSTGKVASPDFFQQIYVNVGAHTEFYNAIQVDTSGGMRKFDPAPTIGAGLVAPLKNDFIFLPEVNWVLPRSVGDSRIIKNLVMFRADLGYDVLDWLRLRAGTSIMWLNQHGRGGSAEVNNGNGTSTFYYPDENRSSLNNTFDLGAEAMFGDWAFRLQTYTYALFKEERRQVSYSLFISYYWDR